jgi:pimeloyl-ACP methyl ester carboxylesterase
MDRTGIERASIVGHSLGGLIAAHLAATEPARVERLVLVDAAVLSYEPGLLRRVPGLIREILFMPPDFPPLIAPDMLRAHPLSFASAVWSLNTVDWTGNLGRIVAPTLVVWGELDTVVPLSVAQRLAATIPNARLEIIPGAGHNVMWQAPDAFNRALINFLRGAG